MFPNTCKRQRCYVTKLQKETNKTSNQQTHKVLYVDDLWEQICMFIGIHQLFKSACLLSKYHRQFVQNIAKIKKILKFEFGDICNEYQMELTHETLHQIYHDWDYLSGLTQKATNNDEITINFENLMCLETTYCIEYWIKRVMNVVLYIDVAKMVLFNLPVQTNYTK